MDRVRSQDAGLIRIIPDNKDEPKACAKQFIALITARLILLILKILHGLNII